MITALSTLVAEHSGGQGEEVTVRSRVASAAMPGEQAGAKTVYLVEDPYNTVEDTVALSFWTQQPSIDGLARTADHVLDTLSIPTADDLEQGDYTPEGAALQRGEELLVRAIPNESGGGRGLYLNVTSFVIRDPDRLISKSKLRTQDRCPREYYLRYVKRVYPGDKFDTPPYEQRNRFRGDAIHKIAENALLEHPERFEDDVWNRERVEQFCEEQFESEFGFRQALLVLSGAGLDVKEHIVDAITCLFTDTGFIERFWAADTFAVEQYLSEAYGYAGRVDILLDGVPYDIKTTRHPDDETIERHARQIKLYLFALLLERIDRGSSFAAAVEEERIGYLLYPNTPDETARFEEVTLTPADVQEFLRARNDVIETGDAFAPPSTYNRDCENCAFAVEEWVSGEDDTLPPACTYHCQNERRWPCYETDGGTLTSDCSLFDRCEQRTVYRDPDVIDHFEATRAAFRKERAARKTTKRVVQRFDADILTDAGYRIPGLEFTGVEAAGTVLRFTTDVPVVPAFDPGETVELRASDGSAGHEAVYFGTDDDDFLFNPLDSSVNVSEYLGSDRDYTVSYTFDADAIDDRYLPYLDYAQRRDNGDQLHATGNAEDGASDADTVAVSEVAAHLDHEELFVDLPVHTDRNELLGSLIRHLIEADYPHPDTGEPLADASKRALILGTRPQQTAVATAAQPDGPHYRLNGTGGPDAIQNDDGFHEIQSRLLESRSLVSTVQLVTSASGPGGVREFFHRLTEGDFGNRAHSDKFFDVVIVLGAQSLTEPEYHFVTDVADRAVGIGDRRRSGPDMLSARATDAGLDAFFTQEFQRYRSFPTESARSLQIAGEAVPGLQTFYPDGPWTAVEGELTFLNIEGDEETAVDEITLEATVPAAEGTGRQLTFDVTDTPLSPLKAQQLFEDRIELDATLLREDSVVVINDESLFLRSKDRLEGDSPTQHHIQIRAVASELPQFSRGLLSNRIAEQIVAETVEETDADIVVTPFERHAARIKDHLAERDDSIPVRRPEELSGEVVDHAILSFATSNPERIVRPPLDDPAVLYAMLSSSRDLTIVGNEPTLNSKDVFSNLIDKAAPYGVES